MHSLDMTQDNIAKIRELFPNCVIEAYGEGGEVALRVDFDLLHQELSSVLVEGGQERYRLDWPGKRQALLTANAPIAKTLRPCREESVDFDTTKNLYIEGDNLDALKLLQESYLGKVKMIYIDPPYNTGNDFIYEDDFAEDTEEYLMRSNQKDEEGNRLVQNSDANGRFHSDWLTMMYSRLKLARNLLRDDGVMLVSADDNEEPRLRTLMDEIFGEKNFISSFIWNSEGHTDNQYDIKNMHEYILVYSKNSQCMSVGYVVDPNVRAESNLWKGFAENSITKNGPGNPYSIITLPAGFPAINKDISFCFQQTDIPKDFFSHVEKLGYISRAITQEYNISYPIKLDVMTVSRGKLTEKCRVLSGWANANKLKKFIDNGCLPFEDTDGTTLEFYLSDRGVIYYKRHRSQARNIVSVLRNLGTTEQMRMALEAFDLYFQYPKPLELLQYLIKVGNACGDDIILDFFSGSATTAHAVMQLNAEDGGNRQFIMVQLPEICSEDSEAFRSKYKTIAEIGKERIRQAGKKILKGECNPGWNKDVGFRVLKVDSSCMEDVYYTPDQINQKQLSLFADNIKADRRDKPEDLLYQVLIDWGVELHMPIKPETIQGKKVFFVDENALAACFDSGISEDFIKELAKRKPLRAVFRDASFASDAARINAEQIFRQLTPHTEVKVI